MHASQDVEDEAMDLIDNAIKGSNVAWNEIIRRYQRRVFAVALSVMRNSDDADEITQEVFVKLYTHMESLKNRDGVGSWLTKTAYNMSCDKLRYRKIRGWLSSSAKSDYDVADDHSVSERIQKAELAETIGKWIDAKLSSKERAVVQLRIGEEMSFLEIAEALGLSQSSVKTYYYRAVDKMKMLSGKGGLL